MRAERLNLRAERPDWRPDRPNLRTWRPDLGPKRPDQGGMDKRTNRRTDKQKSPCVLQEFVPFGAAAQKRKRIVAKVLDGQRYPCPAE